MYEYFVQMLQIKGLSVADVSRATGIGSSTFSNWKARGNVLAADLLLKIAKFLGCSVEELLGADKEMVSEEYYIDEEAREMAQFLFSHPEYRVLFDASKNVKPEDLKKAVQVLGLFTE